MLKLVVLSVIQCLFFASGQVFLKYAMVRIGKFSWTWDFFKELLINWPLLGSGTCMGIGVIIWFYILRHFDFSAAYPLIGMSYIFGVIAAVFIFHETVPYTRWIGVALIIIGVFFVARQ